MRYYILDDNKSVVRALEGVIEEKELGEVIGSQTDAAKAEIEIFNLNPDIVLIDLLMEKVDGITVVKHIKSSKKNIAFIMISKVSNKEMVQEAYRAGVEFFINKPINIIEVESIIKKAIENIEMKKIVDGIKGVMGGAYEIEERHEAEDNLKEIKSLISMLGILGEKGTYDILKICEYLISQNSHYEKSCIDEICGDNGDNPKNMEQRIRRSIKKALTNIANIALDDYGNEIFQSYSNYVFDFANIREEMEAIKGNNSTGGRVNISKFIDGLLMYRELKF